MPNMTQTISMSRGRTAIEHDLKEYVPHNVNADMTKYNKVLVNELNGRTLAEYTNDYMKPYIEFYNSKQRRSDRKKSFDYASDYIKEQNNMASARQSYTAGKLAYEYVIQFGDHESMDVNDVVANTDTYEDIMSMFQEFIISYQEAYPHMRIVLATVHMDEPKGTPHMHILVQPIGEGYKQGLSHQVSLTKALACDGFERSDKKGDRLSLTRWQDDVKDNIMEPILAKHGYSREYREGETHHMPVAMYKRAAAEADAIIEEAEEKADKISADAKSEVKELETQVADCKDELKSLGERNKKIRKEYTMLVDGYELEDGRHNMGYRELLERHKILMKEPERLLETEEGKKVLVRAEDRIVETVYHRIMTGITAFVRKSIFEELKQSLVQPIYHAIDKMMEGHYFKLNKEDEKILTKAIDETVDDVANDLHIGENIENDIKEHLPDIQKVREETHREIRRLRHR